MKLLYVITSTGVGGAEQALVSLVESVTPMHTVRVICLKPLGPLAESLRSSGASVISLEMTGAGLGIVSKLVREIESFKPDIVHAMLFRAIEFARLACAGRNIKLITTPHFDLSQKPFWMKCLDKALKNIDTISCAESAGTYQFLIEKQHYDKAKTLLIKNSIKKSLFFKDNFLKSRLRAEKNFSDTDVVYICVARLAKIKNQRTLLCAFSRMSEHCPQAKLVLVGEGEDRSFLEKQIKELNLTEKVYLAGVQKNVNEWLNLADVFVLISTEECLPLALLEAKQVGLPCIVSDVGDMPQEIIHGKNGFVCKAKDEVLISCLLTELYENASLRQKMGDFSLQKMVLVQESSQQYQQFYQQLVTNKKFSRENLLSKTI